MALWFELGVASVVRPEFRNPAGLLPKLDVVPVCQGLRLFFRGLVVGAHQLNAFNKWPSGPIRYARYSGMAAPLPHFRP
jgi:hypothetical protein